MASGGRLQHLNVAPNRISFDSELVYQAKERLRLTKEQEVIRKSLDRGYGSPLFCRRGSNHRALRQTLADKFAWLRQDQVRLVEFRVESIEIGERETSFGIDYSGQRLSHRIPRLVMPEPEVVDLDSANAYQDAQDFKVPGLERQRGIKACPTLLDECKVKSRRVCDCLHAVLLRGRRRNWLSLVGRGIVVIEGNGGLPLDGERSLESRPGTSIPWAAETCIPAEVLFKLQQVCQPSDILGAGRFTAGQGSENIEIDRLFAL